MGGDHPPHHHHLDSSDFPAGGGLLILEAQLPENQLERTKVHHNEVLLLHVLPVLTVKVVVKGDALPLIDCHNAVIATEVTVAHHAGVTVQVALTDPLVADPLTTHEPDIAAPLTEAELQL